jgi:putative colanic acid biosynthesis UDP-glucose lipid carrier transferase
MSDPQRQAEWQRAMLDRESVYRVFTSPASTLATVAALVDPLLAAGTWLLLHLLFAQPIEGQSIAVMLLVLAMQFPGVNRLGRTDAGVAFGIVSRWLAVVSVLGVCGLVTRDYHEFNTQLVLTWVLSTPFVQWVGTRGLTGVAALLAGRAGLQRRAIVVGCGPMGLRVAGMLGTQVDPGWQVLGLFDDRAPDRLGLPADAPYRGAAGQVPQYVDRHGVQDVFVTLPLSAQPRMVHLLERLQNTTASVHYVPELDAAHVIGGRLEAIGGLPIVALQDSPYVGFNRFVKRCSDLGLASALLLLLSPVMLAVAIGVRLSSPGPVIYRQRRTGLDGEPIWIYKFRSMFTSDEGQDVRHALADDPRITPFGQLLRRHSLDELPQLINVLQGRMSVVGPRPHAVVHNQRYRGLIKAYMVRHKVRPGITGWAQVNGLRGPATTDDKMERRIAHDLDYLRHWSIGLDLLIVARTVLLVLRGRDGR